MAAPFPSGSPYRYWANCGIGSTVTTEDSREIAPGMKMISTTSMTLCAVDDAKVTVDMVVRNRIEGGPVAFPPTEILQEVEIPAVLPPAPTENARGSEGNEDGSWGMWEVTQASLTATDSAVEEGEEILVIAGRSVTCHWSRRTVDAAGLRLTMKVWMSDQVPGGQVRSEVRTEGSPPGVSTSEVVSFLKK